MGHFGYTVDSNILKFVREFGLILFIFAIGIQVGPGFFSSFKKGGVTLNLLAVLGISLNVVIVVCIYLFGNVHDISALVGVMSGAVTNTPGLAAAQQAVSQITNSPEQANLMAQGYAAAYPLGVIGIILSMFVVKAVFRINVDDEIKQLEEEHDSSQLKPDILDIRVTNKLIEGQNPARTARRYHLQLRGIAHHDQRQSDHHPQVVYHHQRRRHTPHSMLGSGFRTFPLGTRSRLRDGLGNHPLPVYSRRILVTNSQFNGVALGSLRLHNGYKLNATRVNRAGVDLLASPSLRLQMGDRITVVGNIEDIDRLASRLGNSMKRLNQPNPHHHLCRYHIRYHPWFNQPRLRHETRSGRWPAGCSYPA